LLRRVWIFIPGLLRSLAFVVYLLLFNSQYTIKVAPVTLQSNSDSLHQHQPTYIKSNRQEVSSLSTKSSLHRFSSQEAAVSFHPAPPLTLNIDNRHTNLVNMTPAHPQAANRPRFILRSDSFTHEDFNAAFAASASQPRTKDLKIRIAQKDETPAPPPSPTEAFSSHRP
jgi:hypothetical protein